MLHMSKFSTFTIYESEMRNFIKELEKQCILDIEKLTEWLYSTGITVYQKSQGALYYPYSVECQKKFGHRPLISFNHSQGQHYTGLVAVKYDLIHAFGNDAVSAIIEKSFNTLVLPAITAHSEFIKIESKIASDFNDFLDKQGELTPLQSLEKVIGLFEAIQDQYPHLQNDFKNKLTLMREVLAEMKKAPAPNQFFKVEEPKQPISVSTSSVVLGSTSTSN